MSNRQGKRWQQRSATPAVLIAAMLDAALREPPLAVHPVRLMGRYLASAERWVAPAPPGRAVVAGGLAWAVGAASAGAVGLIVERCAAGWPGVVRYDAGPMRAVVAATVPGMALWTLFSHRMLLDEVAAVEVALCENLDAGRSAVSRIVSRDVTCLSEAEVRQAAIESLAENMSDSVVAPLLWFAVAGVPGTAVYRFVNTADASWGYRTPRWRYAGLVAARADDLLNLAPARLTSVFLLARRPAKWRELREHARRTPSPNAGWPMAAVAIRLDVRLAKPGGYALNPDGRMPTSADTAAALRLGRRVGWLAIGLAAVVAGARAQMVGRGSLWLR